MSTNYGTLIIVIISCYDFPKKENFDIRPHHFFPLSTKLILHHDAFLSACHGAMFLGGTLLDTVVVVVVVSGLCSENHCYKLIFRKTKERGKEISYSQNKEKTT